MSGSVAIDPHKLLKTASELAGQGAGRGRPSQSRLRRSISTSYYALFHAITRQAAEHILPRGRSEQQLALARTFGHRDIKIACTYISGRQQKVPQYFTAIVDPLKNTIIDAIAASFIDLQQARHTADYDHLVAYSKATALAHVRDAREAIRRLENASARRREMFFALLALSARAN